MKLVIVLMLIALPLFCYAGSGCQDINYVFKKLLDPQESKTEFILDVEEFINSGITEMALKEFKQCFLDQSDETLNNFGDLVQIIFDSEQCAAY